MARRKVIEWLIHRLEHEVDDAHFVMDKWLRRNADQAAIIYRSEKDIPYCKTAGCMAGTLFLGLPAKVRKAYTKLSNQWSYGGANIEAAGREQMGLTINQADNLFCPGIFEMSTISRQDAIAVLKRMLTHSEINWQAIAPDLNWSTNFPPQCLQIELTDD